MNLMLEQFWAAVQTKNGGEYSKSSIVGLRAGINQYLTLSPISRNINMMKEKEFSGSNQVLAGLLKSMKGQGKVISKYKEPLFAEDLNRLYTSGMFSDSKPKTLQNKVILI